MNDDIPHSLVGGAFGFLKCAFTGHDYSRPFLYNWINGHHIDDMMGIMIQRCKKCGHEIKCKDIVLIKKYYPYYRL